jgi:hypothetical protein
MGRLALSGRQLLGDLRDGSIEPLERNLEPPAALCAFGFERRKRFRESGTKACLGTGQTRICPIRDRLRGRSRVGQQHPRLITAARNIRLSLLLRAKHADEGSLGFL